MYSNRDVLLVAFEGRAIRMTKAREPRVKAEIRRAQARDVALAMMRAGKPYQDLTIRDIAAELGIPLSTLNYVYVSINDLLDDFEGYFNAPLLDAVGDGGLRAELATHVARGLQVVAGDPAAAEIARYRLSRLGSGRHQETSIAASEDLITRIRRNARENYRLPDDLIARLYAKGIDGTTLHWLDAPGEEAAQLAYQDMLALIDILAAAADPQPLGSPHTPTAFEFPDYRMASLPS